MIPRSLLRQMTKENLIKRIDLWDFIQEHKNKTKDEFGGWLLGQEIRRTDKMIMAIDLWNIEVNQRLERIIEPWRPGEKSPKPESTPINKFRRNLERLREKFSE